MPAVHPALRITLESCAQAHVHCQSEPRSRLDLKVDRTCELQPTMATRRPACCQARAAKDTHAASDIGSILAGPKRVLDGMFHVRRMFGGNLANGWPAALVARHYMDGFLDRLTSAVRVSEAFYDAMARHPKVTVERIPNGTNLARVTVKAVDPALLARRLAARGVLLPAAASGGVITLGVNETWNRTTAADLVQAFGQALA